MKYLIAFSDEPGARYETRRSKWAAFSVANRFFGDGADHMVIVTPKGLKLTFLQFREFVRDGFVA